MATKVDNSCRLRIAAENRRLSGSNSRPEDLIAQCIRTGIRIDDGHRGAIEFLEITRNLTVQIDAVISCSSTGNDTTGSGRTNFDTRLHARIIDGIANSLCDHIISVVG